MSTTTVEQPASPSEAVTDHQRPGRGKRTRPPVNHSATGATEGPDSESTEDLQTLERDSRSSAREKPKKWPERFIDGLKQCGGNVDRACVAAGVSRTTAYGRRRDDQAFAEEWAAVIEGVVDGIEQTGVGLAMAGDPNLIQFMLKTRRRATYGDRQELTITGQVAHLHISPEDCQRIADERLPELQDKLAKLQRAQR